jgi:hypothetical protein
MSKIEKELAEAETLMGQYLTFRQYGAPAGQSPKNIQRYFDATIEHFLRREEPESVYFGRFNDNEPESPDQLTLEG